MRDFYRIKQNIPKAGVLEIYPDFKIGPSKDIMIKGGKFYAVWDEAAGLWTMDEYRVQEMVDADLREYREKLGDIPGMDIRVKYMENDSSGIWKKYRKYVNDLPDHWKQLDTKLTFSDTEVKKNDYVSKRLPYPLQEGSHAAWDEMIGTLYLPEEREKIE